MTKVSHRAEDAAEERILDALLPPARMGFNEDPAPSSDSNTRQLFRKRMAGDDVPAEVSSRR